MTEKVLLEATLVFPVTDTEVLLAIKQKKIGAGCLNGYGGGIEPGDTNLIEATLRELSEESGGLSGTPEGLQKVAVIDFHNRTLEGTVFICRVHVYLLTQYEGTARSTP